MHFNFCKLNLNKKYISKQLVVNYFFYKKIKFNKNNLKCLNDILYIYVKTTYNNCLISLYWNKQFIFSQTNGMLFKNSTKSRPYSFYETGKFTGIWIRHNLEFVHYKIFFIGLQYGRKSCFNGLIEEIHTNKNSNKLDIKTIQKIKNKKLYYNTIYNESLFLKQKFFWFYILYYKKIKKIKIKFIYLIFLLSYFFHFLKWFIYIFIFNYIKNKFLIKKIPFFIVLYKKILKTFFFKEIKNIILNFKQKKQKFNLFLYKLKKLKQTFKHYVYNIKKTKNIIINSINKFYLCLYTYIKLPSKRVQTYAFNGVKHKKKKRSRTRRHRNTFY